MSDTVHPPSPMQSHNQEVHACMDMSGSMAGKIEDMIGGLRTTISTLKKEKDPNTIINLSIKLFDDKEILGMRSTNIDLVSDDKLEKVLEQYKPRGTTAIRDALGNSLVYFMTMHKMAATPFTSCVIYVMTDGLENASTNPNFLPDNLAAMIKQAEDMNIKILFVGSNQDAILEAATIGISHGQAINYSEDVNSILNVNVAIASAAKRARTEEPIDFLSVERESSVH
jgi:uncharacterized protein YegL